MEGGRLKGIYLPVAVSVANKTIRTGLRLTVKEWVVAYRARHILLQGFLRDTL